MRTLNGLSFKYDKDKILPTLVRNRDRHVEIYEEAMVGYKAACIEALVERVKDVEAEGDHPGGWLCFDLQCPVSYEEAYTTIIDMLSMCEDQVIELTSNQFRSWIKDEWDWRHDFVGSVAAYSARV